MAKQSSGYLGILLVLFVVGLISKFGAFFLVLGTVVLGFWLIMKFFGEKGDSTNARNQTNQAGSSANGYSPTRSSIAKDKDGEKYWVPMGTPVNIAGYAITSGMIYFGTGLAAPRGYGVDCALVDPTLPVNRKDDDYTIRKMNYWPSYSDATPDARASYLKWISSGQQDPAADIGYVFLYFYGLERRLLHDSEYSPVAKGEMQALMGEVQRLLGIYGSNHSFNSYASSLLAYLQAEEYYRYSLAELEAPEHSKHSGFSMPLRLGLGLMAKDGVPIPAAWALSWYCSAPTPPVYTRTSAQRCSEEFGRLFSEEYSRTFRSGIKLTSNKTRLAVTYRPASGSLLGTKSFTKSLNIPDVTVLTSPLTKLAPIIQTCHEKLDNYSRFLGRNPDKTGTLDAILELPLSLWPDNIKTEFDGIKTSLAINENLYGLKFSELLSRFPEWKDKSKKRMTLFLEALEAQGLGFEPDLRFGGPMPDPNSNVVFFGVGDNNQKGNFDAHYALASVSMYLAMIVSQVDGKASDKEVSLLLNQLDRWLHLKPAEQNRLKAHVLWLSNQQLNLAGIKKRLVAIEQGQREFIGNLLVQIAQVDQTVGVAELKLLERIFRLLGLDTNSLYGKVHTMATEPIAVTLPPIHHDGFAIPPIPTASSVADGGALSIDMAKVAALQIDSARVTSILNTIFQGENVQESQDGIETDEADAQEDDIHAEKEATIWGLDRELSRLVLILCEKPIWQKVELEELAQDRGLMIDGALEQVNEVAFEQFDQLFTDGDDPIEINQEIVAVIRQ